MRRWRGESELSDYPDASAHGQRLMPFQVGRGTESAGLRLLLTDGRVPMAPDEALPEEELYSCGRYGSGQDVSDEARFFRSATVF